MDVFGSDITLNVPAGTQTDDLLLAAVYFDNSLPNTITVPAGWTLIREDRATGHQGVALYRHIATATEPASYAWHASATSGFTGIMAGYSGVDSVNPVDAQNGQTGSGTTANAPPLTTTVDGGLLVGVWSTWNSNLSLSAPSGMTMRQRFSRDDPFMLADKPLGVAGATGVQGATVASDAGTWTGQAIALRPRGANGGTPTADLSLVKTASASNVQAGQNITYRITVANGGPSAAASVVVSDTVPANTTFQSVTAPAGWTCGAPAPGGTGSVNCTVDSLASAAAANIDFVVAVNSTTPSGTTISNTATTSSATTDPSLANNSSTATVMVSNAVAAPISFRAATGTDGGGRTLTIARPASAQAGDLLVAAVYWDATSNAITPPAGWTLIRSDGATLEAVSVYYHVAGGPEPQNYAWSASRSSGFTGIIAAYAGVDPSSPIDAAGGQYGASGNATAPSVNTTATNGLLIGVWSAWNNNVALVPPSGMTVRQSFNRSDPLLLADKQLGGPGATGALTATPSSTGGWTGQSIALRPASSGGGSPSADLAITKSAGTATVQPGQNVTYGLTVTNAGPSGASNVTLSDSLPANTTFQSLTSPAGWTCTSPAPGGTGSVTCTIASLASGAQATFSLVVNVNANTAGGTVIANTGAISSSVADPNSANNTATANVTVQAATTTQADLQVTESVASSSVRPGDGAMFTIVVTNSGPDAASQLTLSTAVPTNTTFATVQYPATWACSAPPVGATSGTITCTTASLASGSSATFLVGAHVADVPPGSVVQSSVSIQSSTADPNTANNSASASATVASPPSSTIVFRAASGFTGPTTASRTLTMNQPSGTQANDVLIAAVYWDNSRPNTITPPAGFTLVRQDTVPNGQGVSLYYHVAGPTEPASYTWSATLLSGVTGQILAYSGVDTSNPVDVSGGQTGTDSNLVLPSVTTTADGDMLVAFLSAWNSNRTISGPVGMTQRLQQFQCCPLSSADAALGAPGPTGTRSAFISNAPGFWTAQAVALRKAP